MSRRRRRRAPRRARPLGAGEAAHLLRLARDQQRLLRRLAERCEIGRPGRPVGRPATTLRGPADLAAHIGPELGDLEQEQLRVVLLDRHNRPLGAPLVYQGTADGIDVRLRDCFREAIRAGAAGVVLVHNHPSGSPEASADDVALTAEAGRAGALLGIPVLDHVIVAGEGYVSLREHGLYAPPAESGAEAADGR